MSIHALRWCRFARKCFPAGTIGHCIERSPFRNTVPTSTKAKGSLIELLTTLSNIPRAFWSSRSLFTRKLSLSLSLSTKRETRRGRIFPAKVVRSVKRKSRLVRRALTIPFVTYGTLGRKSDSLHWLNNPAGYQGGSSQHLPWDSPG